MTLPPEQPDNRDLRDLAWCLHSAPLIHLPGDPCWPEQAWYDQWQLPGELNFKVPDNHRLGIRFEALVQQWIETSDQLRLRAANLPIRDHQRTLGEFDLIVETLSESIIQVEHWELAVKFYLGVGDTTDMNRFFGPNPVDTLATKLNRLIDHQMKLSEQLAAAEQLAAMGCSVDRVRGFVKGRLFYPAASWLGNQGAPVSYPKMINPSHGSGWWCELDDFDRLLSKDSHYVPLPKPWWLAPLTPADNPTGLSHANFCELAARHRDGTLHVAETDATGNEISRGFVVFDQWLRDINP